MRTKWNWRLFVAILLQGTTALGQAKWVPYIENPNWRPAASELLESITADRYETEHILDLRPESFDLQQIERYMTLAETGKFADVNEEFECKYTLFRHALARWVLSTDDPSVDESFRRRYMAFQDVCRRLDRAKAFANSDQVQKAEWVKDPFEVYKAFLLAYLDEQALQLDTRENPVRPYTLAEDYMDYPNEANTKQLRSAFFAINRYFESSNYTWNRYIMQYKFQVARQKLYVGEWKREKQNYLPLLNQKRNSPGFRQLLKEQRAATEFAYNRLKKEEKTSCLADFSDVDAMYLSDSLDDYFRKLEEERELKKARAAAGKKKEVVIFIHGLGQDRTCWGEFPELLAMEDVADPTLKSYYRVFVFRYTTQEKSQGVDDFVRDLSLFIEGVKQKEGVDKVSLIAHSFGGVLSLRYMTTNDPKTKKPYKENVERFIALAPSFHGSHMANFMVEMFARPQPKFQRDPPPFGRGMPFVGSMGDLQIKQNQIGSDINLLNFQTLNRKRCLDGIQTLTIIGNPFSFTGLFAPGGRPENDGLVKTFSANLNHIFLEGGASQKDIGYQAAQVRYTALSHFDIIKVMNRNHPAYRYVSSFLRGQLLPQQRPWEFTIKYFLVAVRVAPADPSPGGRTFLPHPQLAPDGEQILPALQVQISAPTIAQIHERKWNSDSGVFFLEGHLTAPPYETTLQLTLSATGYKSRSVHLPVRAGQVTYATELTLEKVSSSVP